jgi:hypothetical protein
MSNPWYRCSYCYHAWPDDGLTASRSGDIDHVSQPDPSTLKRA